MRPMVEDEAIIGREKWKERGAYVRIRETTLMTTI